MKFFLFFLTLVISTAVRAVTINDILTSVDKKLSDLGTQKPEKNLNFKKGKTNIDQLVFNSKGVKYQLEIISPVNAAEFSKNRKIFSVLMLKKYQEEPMSYQGEITKASICPKKFIPILADKISREKEIFIIKYFTSDNYNYRICEEKLATRSTCTAFYFDEKKFQQYKLTTTVSSQAQADCVLTTINFFDKLTIR